MRVDTASALPGSQRNHIERAHRLGGKLQRGLNIVNGELRPSCEDLIDRITIRNRADYDGNQYAGSLNTRIAVMYGGVDRDAFAPVHVLSSTEASRIPVCVMR